jgi:hypothetical protein
MTGAARLVASRLSTDPPPRDGSRVRATDDARAAARTDGSDRRAKTNQSAGHPLISNPYPSHAVPHVTLRIPPSSRPVEKYPPFGSFPGEALVTIDAAPERVICARLMW